MEMKGGKNKHKLTQLINMAIHSHTGGVLKT